MNPSDGLGNREGAPSRRMLLAALAGALANWPLAASAADSVPRPAAQPVDIQAPIVALDTALLAAMHAGQATPFQKRYDTIAPTIDRAFDLAAILQASVGPVWAGFPVDQQSRLLEIFRRFTVASYTANFDSFSGEKFDVLPDLRVAGSEQIVQTRIVPASGAPTPIDYVMRQTEGWRAIDVLLDGSISRVAVQRSDFRSVLRGGGAAALIESLQRKVTDLSGGKLI